MSISWVAYPNVLLGSANSIKMLSYCTRIAARPPISQPEARKTAVTITRSASTTSSHFKDVLESIFLKTQSGGFPTLRLPTNHENK